jgi:hypothetical protein
MGPSSYKYMYAETYITLGYKAPSVADCEEHANDEGGGQEQHEQQEQQEQHEQQKQQEQQEQQEKQKKQEGKEEQQTEQKAEEQEGEVRNAARTAVPLDTVFEASYVAEHTRRQLLVAVAFEARKLQLRDKLAGFQDYYQQHDAWSEQTQGVFEEIERYLGSEEWRAVVL